MSNVPPPPVFGERAPLPIKPAEKEILPEPEVVPVETATPVGELSEPENNAEPEKIKTSSKKPGFWLHALRFVAAAALLVGACVLGYYALEMLL